MNLLLTRGQALRVQVAELEGREYFLDGRRPVRVGAAVYNWQGQPGQSSLHDRIRVPGCIVKQDGSVLLPPWAFEVKSPHEIAKECGHDISVSVGLCQGKPDFALCVKGRQQRYPWVHLLVGEGACSVRWDPDTPNEAGPIQPAFVHVDDATRRFKKWQ